MKKLILCLCLTPLMALAQDRMTPELLWQLGRVTTAGVTKDGKQVVYKVTTYNTAENTNTVRTYAIPVSGGQPVELKAATDLLPDKHVSSDGDFKIVVKDAKIQKIQGKEYYTDLQKSNVQIYDGLNFRHWDTWEDGAYSHLFVHPFNGGVLGDGKDIMAGEPHDSPQKPFGDEADYTWRPDGKAIVYVCKKKSGTEYAKSTNTDLYEYVVATGVTTNLTEGMMGYDTEPAFSPNGQLTWLSMKRDGFEADKNDIMVRNGTVTLNLTQQWDGTVTHFRWSNDGKKVYFVAPLDGTIQLFEVDYPGLTKKMPVVKQITKGDFDITSIAGQSGNTLLVARNDMNHSSEVFSVNLSNGQMTQISHVNDDAYSKIKLSKTERRRVTTTDGKQMLVWVIYPPDFDPAKKYPTLLYCQGGPQSPLTQMYSYRWNFQLMAANGYIVVAPNRRGMQGHGVAWNEQISKDHGGQSINDYLSAIDDVSKESYVDRTRVGCVGPSYGGFSVYYLAGIHNNRFKSFIAHDGIFNTKSMYGSTEEIFFTDWDYGGPYWEKNNTAAQKTYTQFDPSSNIDKWNTPILIFQGGKDYRVPDTQSFEAFTAAQLRGIKSRLVYLPEENHWVLSPQNALVWQREFYRWLKETL
jgi:dipeptidyl aminopeptidase/acylaminoacyl peptidase